MVIAKSPDSDTVGFTHRYLDVDKLNKSEKAKFLADYTEEMLKQWHKMPPVVITSSETKEGREELLNFFEQTNSLF